MLHYCSLRASLENLILSALQGNSERRLQNEKGKMDVKERSKNKKAVGKVWERKHYIKYNRSGGRKIWLTLIEISEVGQEY